VLLAQMLTYQIALVRAVPIIDPILKVTLGAQNLIGGAVLNRSLLYRTQTIKVVSMKSLAIALASKTKAAREPTIAIDGKMITQGRRAQLSV
jgi:hypothetical protein